MYAYTYAYAFVDMNQISFLQLYSFILNQVKINISLNFRKHTTFQTKKNKEKKLNYKNTDFFKSPPFF